VKAIGFDADGVLLDSQAAAWAAAEQVLGAFGLTASIQSPESMEAAFGHDAQNALVGPGHAGVLRAMHRLIMRRSAPRIGLFHEAISVVTRLPPPRVLVTAALGDGVTTCLGAHARLFDRIIGFESGRKPDLLGQLAKDLSIYVTDTATDIADCKRLGIPTVGCSWGYDPHATIEAAEPDEIADTPAQLFEVINRLTRKELP
jgi:phosphoglycolate phosphatase-like HAD superfamily hydrolase